ncbi:MAG: Gfo/Idh/MocA family oxidoreductase [Bacteroidetes bacterium]|nr:Gfo/Idh/MocA family oxidoreductase [Bacteroidota bacterium]
MDRLKIGILGCANIAKKSLLPALISPHSKFIVEGIASRSKNKSMELASDYNCEAYEGYDSLITKGNIDVVYIPLPNALHFEWIMKALDNGIHVLAEKSLSCSLSETVQITNKAREKKLAVVENFQFRFHSQLKYISDLVKDNVIGELRSVRSSFGFPPFDEKENIRYKKELGGGALFDAGAYPVKISQIFLGENISVQAAKLHFDNRYDVDTWGGAFLSEDNSSIFSEIAFGFDNFYQCNLELWGSKGKIVAERIFTAPPGFQPTISFETTEKKETKLLPADNHFINMLNYLHELILSGSFEKEHKQNLNQSRLLEEIKELAKK